MDSTIMQLLLCQFNSSVELHQWAEKEGALCDPHVRHRLQELLWQEVREDLGLPIQNNDDPDPEQQIVDKIEESLEPRQLTEEELQILTADGVNADYDFLSTQTTEKKTNPEIIADISPDEISMLSADAVNEQLAPVIPVGNCTNQATDDRQTEKSKYFKCSRCHQTFRRIQMLREHRKLCRTSDDEAPPSKKMRQTTLGQYGGEAPSTSVSQLPSTSYQDNRLDQQKAISDQPSPSTPPSSQNVPQYHLIKKGEKTFKKDGARDVMYEVRLNHEDWNGKRIKDVHEQLRNMFADVIRQARGSLTDEDMGRVIIHHPDLTNPIVISLRPLKNLNPEVIMSIIENVLSSHENLAIDDSLNINVGTIEIPKGGKHLGITSTSGENNSILRKKSMIHITNNDNLCMARALVMCAAKVNNISKQEWAKMKNPRCHAQTSAATHLCQSAGVPLDRMANLNDIPQFEESLQLQILVISERHNNKFIYTGTPVEGRKKVYMYLTEAKGVPHFHAITKIAGFFSQSYFCETCLKPTQSKKNHSCDTHCMVCASFECPETDNPMKCAECNMTCRSRSCYVRHKEPRGTKKKTLPSHCNTWWRCPTCKKVIDQTKHKKEDHQCGEWLCQCCERYVIGDHLCFLRVKEPLPIQTKFIMFDFETRQDDIHQCSHGYVPTSTIPCERCLKDGHRCNKCASCKNCSWSSCGRPVHRPNFVVAYKTCLMCIDDDMEPDAKCNNCGERCKKCYTIDETMGTYADPPCDTCAHREVIFSGDNTTTDFGRWLFDEKHQNYTVLAQNMKGFDGYFLLEYLISNSILPSKILYAGSKIMHLQVERGLNIKVSDSLNFLPMKLSALPKAFGLDELKKGWFPHNFNRKENQNYKGPYPDPSYYGYDYMSTKDRTQFLKWHQDQQDTIFDFQKEMLEYCRSDVMILVQACMKFRDLMINLTKQSEYVIDQTSMRVVEQIKAVDPFNYVTIASVCMGIYRWKFLEEEWRVDLRDEAGSDFTDIKARMWNGKMGFWLEDEWVTQEDLEEVQKMRVIKQNFIKSPLAQVPVSGYVKKQQFSQSSIQWLEWVRHQEELKGNQIHIQHALNENGEKVIKVDQKTTYRLDGYCAATNTVYEYHGCRFHGCPECFPEGRQEIKDPRTKQSLEELYALTLKKRTYLENRGMRYVEMWEHDFLAQLKTDADLQVFIGTLDIESRLDPRNSFFGGRTNACRLHYKVQEGEKVKYVDFTSLYPFINKAKQYPVGHPEIITQDFKSIDEYFGVAKVKILPPRELYHPVLPYRSNGKLKFPLCRTCADNEHQKRCECSDEERVIVGTWCSPELDMAVKKGYCILKIYEVYHWKETTQYNPHTGQGGLFAPYINTFLKYKQEASGWPDWCQTLSDKERYVQQYEAHEKIHLDKENIEKNPGLRSLAKLCLNSFWGKFGENLRKPQTAFIHDNEAEKFIQMVTSPDKEVTNFHIVADDIIQVEWKDKKESQDEDLKTNIFLATFTTCWARLELYKVLDKLGRRVLYFDTDSIIYVSRPGQYDPPLGDYLGELTSELGCGDVGCKDNTCDGEHWITELISGGPKNYAYCTNNDHTTCKVRGFTLNHKNAQLVNFNTIKELIVDSAMEFITITNPSKISREKYGQKIYNRPENKDYRMVYTKRVLLEDLDTLPYGY